MVILVNSGGGDLTQTLQYCVLAELQAWCRAVISCSLPASFSILLSAWRQSHLHSNSKGAALHANKQLPAALPEGIICSTSGSLTVQAAQTTPQLEFSGCTTLTDFGLQHSSSLVCHSISILTSTLMEWQYETSLLGLPQQLAEHLDRLAPKYNTRTNKASLLTRIKAGHMAVARNKMAIVRRQDMGASNACYIHPQMQIWATGHTGL